MHFTMDISNVLLQSLDAHVKTLKKGLDTADIILTTGGTSMGASDLLKVSGVVLLCCSVSDVFCSPSSRITLTAQFTLGA